MSFFRNIQACQNVLAARNFPINRKSFTACFTLECSLSQKDPFLAAYFFCCLQLQIILAGLNISVNKKSFYCQVFLHYTWMFDQDMAPVIFDSGTCFNVSEFKNSKWPVQCESQQTCNGESHQLFALWSSKLNEVKMKDKIIFGMSKEQQNFAQLDGRQAKNMIIKKAMPTDWNYQFYKDLKVI